jgi:hypothetical protein
VKSCHFPLIAAAGGARLLLGRWIGGSGRNIVLVWNDVVDVLSRVLSEATGATIEAFADSFTVSIVVPTNRLYAAATALREMRLI